jgi:DNA replication protein DnaC
MTTDLQETLKKIKLHWLAANLDDFTARSTKSRLSPIQMIEQIAKAEIQEAKQINLAKRMADARLGNFRSFDQFDWSWPKELDRDTVESLLSLSFIEENRNAIFVGPAGIGKTMLAKNIAHKAILAGKTAWFRSAAQILNDLQTKETYRSANLSAQRFSKPDLLVIDELGYLSYETRAADLLFQLIQSRYETKSVIVTMNVAFGEWNTVFPSAACVSAMIDRLTHHATILSFAGESYRLKESSENQVKTKAKAKKGSKHDVRR